jgi:hypothetical protein
MTRRALLAIAALLGPLKGVVAACTEVKHGPSPQWNAKTTPGSYRCTVVGYYTDTHDLTAAGVESWSFASNRPAKRMPELLGMRTAFLDWFLKQYQELGGSREDAIAEVAFIVDAWKKDLVCVVTETGWELRQRGAPMER